jgi:ketosteroid isomerase-like protein
MDRECYCVLIDDIHGGLLNRARKYENQYMWLFHVVDNPADSQIKVTNEFFDSLYCARMWGVLPAEG